MVGDGDVVMSDGADRHKHLCKVLYRKSPFADEDCFQPGEETRKYLQEECKVLVIGAGGLGCEILKDLALSGFRDIHVIDMDTIDITNLNRQFLFRSRDVGRPKADVAADFINRRCGHMGVNVTPHNCKIQDYAEDFYSQFNVIIAGLDNITARRWINSLLHTMVEFDEDENPDGSTIKPLLDGGTEGLKGQSRVIIPYMTSCFDCSLDSFPPQVNYPMCTIAETPRLPEHCIEYVLVVEWDKHFPNRKLNTDSPQDMKWIFDQAKERADTFGIRGVTYSLTMGVVKRIIPAVASTNALIAASLVNEALKISTYCGPVLNTYMMYMGNEGVYIHTFEYEKKDDCLVCSGTIRNLSMPAATSLQGLIDSLCADPSLKLQRPSITSDKAVVFMSSPLLRKDHEYKLPMTLRQLVDEGVLGENEVLIVTDPIIPSKLKIRIALT